jgi:uncharacterized protein YigA (DUF484 family)
MKPTLYQIKNEYFELMEQIEAQGGEITDEISEALTINETHLKEKSLAYMDFIGSLEAKNQRIDTEVKRLQQMKRANDKIVERMKMALATAVIEFGDFESGLHSFTTRKSESIEVEDVSLLPQEYVKIKVEQMADKVKIKEAMKQGIEVTGARVVTKQNLSIK